jgi:hypothetical protein
MVPIFLVLLLLLRLNPPVGSSQMAHMISSSATNLSCDSFETQASSTSVFFLGLPLLRGILFWGDGASTVFPPCTIISASGSARFDLIISMGKGITPSTSLGMPVAGLNDSQVFWGLDLTIMLLRTPFLILWEATMARRVCILCTVYPTNAQGRNFDQPELAREIEKKMRACFMTEMGADHLEFITSREKGGIIPENSEFMAMRYFEYNCKFSMAHPVKNQISI